MTKLLLLPFALLALSLVNPAWAAPQANPAQAFAEGLKDYESGDLTRAAQSLEGLPENPGLAPEARLYAGLLQAKVLLQSNRGLDARNRLAQVAGMGLSVTAHAQVDFDLYFSYLLRNVPPRDSRLSLAVAERAFSLEPASQDVRLNLLKSLLRRGWFLESAHDQAGLAQVLDRAQAIQQGIAADGDAELGSDLKNLLGQILYLRHRYTEAVDAFAASQALSPRSANHRNIGWSLVLAQGPQSPCPERLAALLHAKAEFQEATRLNDTNSATERELGTMQPEIDQLTRNCGGK
jgi:hypothetical protein